jgi:tetraacyldisaccharide 4'-kinase
MILGAVSRVRRLLFSKGLLPSARLPVPVVSVGNLAMGGAGKTPHVIHLARWLAGEGMRVGVLSRGYGRKTRGVRWVSGGEGGIATAAEGGDEPVLIARSLPGIPVVVGESRAAAGRELLTRRRVDVFLLDDGFQHLSLRRDVDLLLIDSVRGLGNRKTAPFGMLREPPSHARFADGLVITKCADVDSGTLAARDIPFPEGRPRAFSRLSPGGIVGREGLFTRKPVSGDAVFAFSGLAGNEQFRETLLSAGFRVKGFLPFPDHHMYSRRDLERIAKETGGYPAITTEKDLVRLPADVPFFVGALRVDVEYLCGWKEISAMILERIDRGPSA